VAERKICVLGVVVADSAASAVQSYKRGAEGRALDLEDNKLAVRRVGTG
jgi:hypothetical protein